MGRGLLREGVVVVLQIYFTTALLGLLSPTVGGLVVLGDFGSEKRILSFLCAGAAITWLGCRILLAWLGLAHAREDVDVFRNMRRPQRKEEAEKH